MGFAIGGGILADILTRAPAGRRGAASTGAVPARGMPARLPALPEFTSPPRSAVSDDEASAAMAINAATPARPGAIVAAYPFVFTPQGSAIDRVRARYCLAAAVYYEAAGESLAGQRAVAQVVLNRLRHPVYPRTICAVVFQGSDRATGCQFTFTCDGSLARRPDAGGWQRALRVADAALDGHVERGVGTATHYHADWVAPYWRSSLTKLVTIGAHIFYRWQGGPGERAAFGMAYHGGETEMQSDALASDAFIAALPETFPVDQAVTSSSSSRLNTILPPSPVGADRDRTSLEADAQPGTLLADERAARLPD